MHLPSAWKLTEADNSPVIYAMWTRLSFRNVRLQFILAIFSDLLLTNPVSQRMCKFKHY